jgi:hypothetical protein
MVRSGARLRRITILEEAVKGLPDRSLFHAGPPYRARRPNAVLNAAAQAAVIAGWAGDLTAARGHLENGDITLQPGQDHGVAVPLAMVVAPSMWCVEVGNDSSVYYSPMSEGPPPALRFGATARECQDRAKDWCPRAASIINSRLDRVPALEDLIAAALDQCDECHAITGAGNQLFVDALGDIPAWLRDDLLRNPGFVLAIWMAWAGWKLQSTGSPITAAGGNGIEFGLRQPNSKRWRTAKAETPIGTFFKSDRTEAGLGAIGDSALVDLCGLGGQSLRFAPKLLQEWAHVLPKDIMTRHERILDAGTGIVAASRVLETDTGPIINLAIVDREGGGFPIGRGIYVVQPNLFEMGA